MKISHIKKRGIVMLMVAALLISQGNTVWAAEPSVTISQVEADTATETSESSQEEGSETPKESATPDAVSTEQPGVPSEEPTAEPTETPTETPEVSLEEPTAAPTETPAVALEEPTAEPTETPTETPAVALEEPTAEPSETPTETPAVALEEPTAEPSEAPTAIPEELPAVSPSVSPSATPSAIPTGTPSVSPTPILEDEEALFPGLEEGYSLSEKEIERKKKLQDYVSAIEGMEEGVDFVANVVLVTAETAELAEAYGRAFGGYVEKYESGLAVIGLNKEKEQTKVTVAKAVAASADLESNLPAAWPNYICHTTSKSLGKEVSRETMISIGGGTDIGADGVGLVSGYTDTFLSYQWHHEVIGSEFAWDAGYSGEGVTVAILSTGVNSAVEDMDSSKLESIDLGIGASADNEQGTHLTTLIGANGGNDIAGSGIANGIEKLMIIDIFGSDGEGSDYDTFLGIWKAIEAGADVICLDYYSDFYSEDVDGIINAAYFNYGVPVFCAAGNEASNSTSYPSAYTHSVAVAALNQNNSRASFSNYGKDIRYSAPGADIYANVSSEYLKNVSGTGQAAAIVAAEAAVILSSGKITEAGQWRVDALLELMDKSCEKVSGSGLGKGMPTLTKALTLQNTVKKPDKPTFSVKGGTYTTDRIKVTFNAQPGTWIYYSTDGKDVTYKNGVLSDNASWAFAPGDEISVTGRTTTIKAIAVSKYTGLASSVASVKYTLKPLPTGIEIQPATDLFVVARGKSLKFTTDVYPAYSGDYKIEWSLENPADGISIKNGTLSVGKNSTAASVIVKAEVMDKKGNPLGVYASEYVNITEADNLMTSIFVSPTKKLTVNIGEPIELSVKTKYQDGYESTSVGNLNWEPENRNIATAEEDGDVLIVEGWKVGKTKIHGYDVNGSGKSVTLEVTVKQLVNGIDITGSQILAAGKSITLNTQVTPLQATNKKVKWSVSPANAGVKVSSSGKVSATAAAAGKTFYIYATAADGSGIVSDGYPITVTSGRMKSLKLDAKSVEIARIENARGKGIWEKEIKVTTTGSNTSCWEVINSAPGVVWVDANVDTGTITVQPNFSSGVSGTATITVKSTDGSNLKATCKVIVSNPPTSIYISLPAGRSSSLAQGKTLQLSAILGDDAGALNARSKKVVWESSDPEKFPVNQKGKVTCKTNSGSAWITVRTTDGTDMEASIEIKATNIMKSIELTNVPKKINVAKGNTLAYGMAITTKDGSNTYLGYDVAVSVNKAGLVVWSDDRYVYFTGDKPGTYKVTLSLKDGNTVKKTYTVKVL